MKNSLVVLLGFGVSLITVSAVADFPSEQLDQLNKIVDAGCSIAGDKNQCKASEQGFANSLIDGDQNIFEKNKAGLIVNICSNYKGNDAVNCYARSSQEAGDEITRLYQIPSESLEYSEIWSTWTRVHLYTKLSNNNVRKITDSGAYSGRTFLNTRLVPLLSRLFREYAGSNQPFLKTSDVLKLNFINIDDAAKFETQVGPESSANLLNFPLRTSP